MKKLNVKGFYEYKILPSLNVESRCSNQRHYISNDEQEKALIYKDDGISEPMTVNQFLDEIQDINNFMYILGLRSRAPLLIFFESDKIALKIFPQYNCN